MPRWFPPGSADCGRNGGFALIIVLWTLVLIGFLVAHITASGRTEIRIAGNLVANSAAQAAADGAIFDAIFNLSNPQPEQRWPVDGTPRQVTIGASRVLVRLEDEASWINPSTASPLLLEALLRVTGSDADSARRLATAIGEWVGSAQTPRPQDAVLAEYRAAGLDYGPPGGPIETLGELGRVLGMTPAMLSAIRPHLTLFGPPEPNPTTTDPVVAAALALSSAGAPAGPLAQAGQTPQDAQTVRVTALAAGPGNARVTRTAVVRTGAAAPPQGYAVLAWGGGLGAEVSSPAPPQPAITR
jgi:general secretion pathway protein K